MAEENEEIDTEEEEEESSAGGGGKLILIIGLVNTIGLIVLAFLIATGRLGGGGTVAPDDAGDIAAAGSDDPNAVKRPSGEAGPTVDVGELKVNLRDPAGGKMLMTKIQLELDTEESRAEVEQRIGSIRYALTRLLSEQKSSDCIGQKQMETLRKQMLRRANSRLNKARIKEVWPTEWIVD